PSSTHLFPAAWLPNEFAVPENRFSAKPRFDHASAQFRTEVRRNLMAKLQVLRRNRPNLIRIKDHKVRVRTRSQRPLLAAEAPQSRWPSGHPLADSLEGNPAFSHARPQNGECQAKTGNPAPSLI